MRWPIGLPRLRGWALVVGAVVGTALLGGCSGSSGFRLPQDKVRVSTGYSQVAVLPGGDIAAVSGACLRGYDADLKPLWECELIEPPGAVQIGEGGNLYFCGRIGLNGDIFNTAPLSLIAINSAGLVLWACPLGDVYDPYAGMPIPLPGPDGMVFVEELHYPTGLVADSLVCVGPDGAIRWKLNGYFSAGGHDSKMQVVGESVLVVASRVYDGVLPSGDDEFIAGISLDGRELWRCLPTRPPTPDPEAASEIACTILTPSGLLALALDGQGRFVDVERGNPLLDSRWIIRQGERDPLGRVWTSGYNAITRWDESGSPAWRLASAGPEVAAPSLLGFYQDGGILALARNHYSAYPPSLARYGHDGERLWEQRPEPGIVDTVLATEGSLYLATTQMGPYEPQGGCLIRLDEDGKEMARVVSTGYYYRNAYIAFPD